MLSFYVFTRTERRPPNFDPVERVSAWPEGVLPKSPVSRSYPSFTFKRSPQLRFPPLNPFLFIFLRTLLHFFALAKNLSLLFSGHSALFAKKTRGVGAPKLPANHSSAAPHLVGSPISRLGPRIQFGVLWSHMSQAAPLRGAFN